jgi:hypothetical protein
MGIGGQFSCDRSSSVWQTPRTRSRGRRQIILKILRQIIFKMTGTPSSLPTDLAHDAVLYDTQSRGGRSRPDLVSPSRKREMLLYVEAACARGRERRRGLADEAGSSSAAEAVADRRRRPSPSSLAITERRAEYPGAVIG